MKYIIKPNKSFQQDVSEQT